MKILVTGAKGFVGKNLVAELENTYIVDEQGHKRKVRRKDSTMN